MRVVTRHPLIVFALLAVFHLYPLSVAPATQSLNHHADAKLLEWTLSWIARAVVVQPTRLFDGNIFAPEPHVLTLSDPLVVPGLIGAPIRWLGASPVLTYNLVQFIGFLVTAWAAWFVCRRWTGSPTAAFTAGALAAFNVHVLARMAHVQAVHVWGLPLALYFADRLIVRVTRRDAIALALVVATTAATSLYTLTFTAVIIGLVALVGVRQWRGVLAITASSVVGLLVASPILWPYVRVAQSGASRPLEVVAQFSATPVAYLTGNSLAYVTATGSTARDELQVLFAGGVALVLAAIGVIGMLKSRAPAAPDEFPAAAAARERRRLLTVLAIGAAGVLLSFGPSTPLYRWLYELAMPLRGLRAVARFSYLYLLAVALLAGAGVAWLQTRTRSRWVGSAIAMTALVLVSAEAWMGPVRTVPFEGLPPIYTVIRDTPPPVMLVEVPFFPPEAVFENSEYVLNATAHWRPVMNGYSGATPQSYRTRAEAFWYFPRDWAIDTMIREGATHVMVHLDRLDARDTQDIETTLPTRTDLKLIASDEHGHRLYEVMRR